MTDRYNAFIVVLEHDMRDDDAQPILNAIKQLRGVLSVEPHTSTPDEHIAEARVRNELGQQLFRVLYPEREQR